MVEETIKKRVLEETEEYFTEEGGGVYDCRLCGESGFMQLEDLVSHLYEEHPREFCDCAIDFTEKLTREEEDKATAKIQKTLIASTQLLNKQIIQYEIEKEHEKVLKIIDNIDDEEFAELFHKEYEKASFAYGWKTQEKCQTDFWSLPEENRKAMIGTVIQIKLWLWKLIDDVFKFKTEVENDAKT